MSSFMNYKRQVPQITLLDALANSCEQNKDFAPYYLSCWAYHVKLECMETVLLLGFELELYGVHEYTMIYL